MTVTKPTLSCIPCTFLFLRSVSLHLLHFCWLECILTLLVIMTDRTNTERYLYFSLFLRSVLLHLLHFCWLECILTPHSWCFFCLQTLQDGGEASWEDEKDCSLPTTCRSYERGPTVTTWSSVLTVVHYVDLNPNKEKHCCSQPTVCRSYEGKPARAVLSFILNVIGYSETRMTASVLKQDPNTREVQNNAVYLT